MLAIKIAWRNLFRHRGKSFVIGTILFVGSFLLTLGNAVISGMEQGLDKSVVEGFTGDAIIVSIDQEDDNVVLGMMGKAVEDISRFDTLETHLRSSGLFANLLPVGKNFAMAINEHGGTAGYAFLFGVNFREWKSMFPNSVQILQGQYPDSAGLLMSTGGLEQLYTTMGIWFQPQGIPIDTAILPPDAKESYPAILQQNDIVFMGFNEANTSTDIRMPLAGISRFHALNKIWGHFLFVDISAYRRCMGYFSSTDQAAELTTVQQTLLSSENENLDALFGSDVAQSAKPQKSDLTVEAKQPPATEHAGVYNLILSRFKAGLDRDIALDSLSRFIEANHLPLRALSWQKATGPIGSMTIIIKIALNVFVFFLFFVAIIIIINTLSMAAMERTSEIGMMRAIGAQRGFISTMFLGETACLSTVFGGLGIAAGITVVSLVQHMGFTTDNDILQLFYGGDTFHPLFGWSDFLLTSFQLFAVTVLAAIYPVRIANAITPLDAISRD